MRTKFVPFSFALGLVLSPISAQTPLCLLPRSLSSIPKPSAKRVAPPRFVPMMQSVKALKAHLHMLKQNSEPDQDDLNKAEAAKKQTAPGVETENGADYYEAWLYFLQQRAYPGDTLNWQAYAAAEDVRNALPPARLGPRRGGIGAQALSASWEFAGPRNLPVPYRIYYGVGRLNGRTNALAYNPTNPSIAYAGAAGGGVWKTTDGGVTWTPLSDGWTALRVSALAVDPLRPQTIYAGTGDYPGFEPTTGRGVMKSTDGGATWQKLTGLNSGQIPISSIVVDPENSQKVTVAGGQRDRYGSGNVWQSNNGGTTWSVVLNIGNVVSWSGLSIGAKDVDGNRVYYACGESTTGALYSSTDRGGSWTPMPLPSTGAQYQYSVSVAASKVNPQTVFLMRGYESEILQSDDGGNTWNDITAGLPVGNNGYNWSQAYYDYHLTTSTYPLQGGGTGDVLYTGLIDLAQWREGAGWQSIGGPTFDNSSILHNDQHCMTINPQNPNEALVGCDGGVFRLVYSPNSNTWTVNNLNPVGDRTQFYRVAVHPADSTRFIGGAQDNATPATLGDLSNSRNVGGGDGGFCAILDNNNQYATAQGLSIYRTTTGWNSSSYISANWGSDNVGFIAPIALTPNGAALYAGTDYLSRYNVSGTTGTWTQRLASQVLAGSGYTLEYIAVAPSNSSVIYTGSGDGQVWMTTNSGASFTQINTGTVSLPNRTVTSIVVNSTNPNEVWVTVSGTGSAHLWRCTNTAAGASRTWQNVSGSGANALPDIFTNAVALDPITPAATWYVGTDVGVFATNDAGVTWANATAPLGLPNVQVNDLKIQNGAIKYLYAGTYGRGIWRIPLVSVVRTVSGTVTLQACLASALSAQPVTFEFRNPTNGAVQFQRTITLAAGGAYSLANIPSGSYNVGIKAPKWLRKVVSCNASAGNVAGLNATLLAGDANNNNVVDVDDLTVLLNVYNTAAGDGIYLAAADFDGNGTVNVDDLTILLNNYNTAGTP